MKEKENEVIEKAEEVKEKKGKNILKYFIFVILVACLCAGFFFLGTTFNSGDDKKEGSNKVTEETKDDETSKENTPPTLTKDSKEVTDLFAIYMETRNGMHDTSRDYDLSKDYVKKSLAVGELEKENKMSKRTCGSLSAFYVNGAFCDSYDLVYNDASGEIDYTKSAEASKNHEVKVYNPTELKTKYFELFGQNAQYSDGDFELTLYPCGYAYYDKANNLYAHYTEGCGSAVAEATHTLDGIEQNGTSLKLLTTFSVTDEPTVKIEYSFEYEKETGNYIFVSRVVK